MKRTTGSIRRFVSTRRQCRGWAGGVLLTRTADLSGLSTALRHGLGRWRKPTAVHDPAKVLTDLAASLVFGGHCLADAALLRCEPGINRLVASDATVSCTIGAPANDADGVLTAVGEGVGLHALGCGGLAGTQASNHAVIADDPLMVDLDATLVTCHSHNELTAPNFKRGFGFHSLCAFVDHGPAGTREALAIALRPGNAGSDTAADHIAVTFADRMPAAENL